jgi:hypothetical protein
MDMRINQPPHHCYIMTTINSDEPIDRHYCEDYESALTHFAKRKSLPMYAFLQIFRVHVDVDRPQSLKKGL